MSVPNVDTFEHDIAEEIKKKEASMTDIASASNDVGNTPATPAASSSKLLLILGILSVITVIAIAVVLYLSYTKGTVPPVDAQQPISQASPSERADRSLLSLSESLHDALGENISAVTQSSYGYTLMLREYTPVFAYMIRNEEAYADELAFSVHSPRDTSTSSLPFSFEDVTMSNQNMRLGTSGSSTVVYAFVNGHSLLISSSTEGILSLRGAILR
jgi:hypothetical protein